MVFKMKWPTDLKVKLPKVHWIRQRHYDNAAESILSWIIKKTIWLAMYGGYSLYHDLLPIVKNLIDKINI